MENKNKTFLSGLWRHTSKKGQTYYTGTLGGGRLLIFANNHKKNADSPDLMLYLAPATAPASAPAAEEVFPDEAASEDTLEEFR